MLVIFQRAVEDQSIDADRFQTLSCIARNGKLLGMPASVADLTCKVVLGDPANAHYQHKPLGDLHVGSSVNQLDCLVRKWFLGEDPPDLDGRLHYEAAAGVLFDGPPKLLDLHQGDLGDCYFVAVLGELALRRPDQIERMIGDNRDGTFTVRFFHDGEPTFVTVDRYFPVNDKGRFVYENRGESAGDPKVVLWVAVAEKAFAQLNESGWLVTAGPAGENSFAAIGTGGKSRNTLPLVTSLAGSRDGLKSVGSFNAGELQLANSKPNVPAYLVPHHSYVVVGYDAARGEVTLFNPWGDHGTKKDIKYGAFTMNWQDFWKNFKSIDRTPVNVASAASTKGRNGTATTGAPKNGRNRIAAR